MSCAELVGDASLPVVVVLGGISATRHVTSHAADGRPGWWESFVGQGRAVDLRRFRVFGLDWAACSGAPVLTHDQARALALALDQEGIRAVHAIVGASYGGMVALAFAAQFPQRVGRLAVISAAHESHPMATAVRSIQRRIVRLGLERGCAGEAVALARALAMTTYRTAEEFAARFDGRPTRSGRFPVEEYLDRCGERFAAEVSPERFLALSESLDLHRVTPEAVAVPTHLLAVSEDTLVPPWQMQALRARLGGTASLSEIRSAYGHDAFLKETEIVSRFVSHVLDNGVAS